MRNDYKVKRTSISGNRRPFHLLIIKNILRCPLELAVIKIGIEAALGEKLLMIAAFDHITVLQHKDQVGVFDRGKPMGDTKEVRPSLSFAIASCARSSDLVSTELVASSRISGDAFSIIARAMVAVQISFK